jgi:hypothetical protein
MTHPDAPDPADPAPSGDEAPRTPPQPSTPGDGSTRLDPTRYGAWEKNGRCIDF